MACYHPIPALQKGSAQPKLWPKGEANMRIPCGTCLGCRAAHATQWAHRADHEARSWEHNSFVTLTYDDANLPPDGHLDAHALTRFVKRLRKRSGRDRHRIRRNPESPIRYFACGEYGDENQRPHYHLLLFNAGFTGHRVAKDQYESDILNELWPHGKHTWGPATPGAAGNYIAKYQLKKQGAGDHDADGVWRPAPFLRMSLKPPIGARWLEKWKDDLQHGYLISNGRKHSIPRTYREKLAALDPELAAYIMDKTKTYQLTNNKEDNNNPQRRKAAEQIHERQKQLTKSRNL